MGRCAPELVQRLNAGAAQAAPAREDRHPKGGDRAAGSVSEANRAVRQRRLAQTALIFTPKSSRRGTAMPKPPQVICATTDSGSTAGNTRGPFPGDGSSCARQRRRPVDPVGGALGMAKSRGGASRLCSGHQSVSGPQSGLFTGSSMGSSSNRVTARITSGIGRPPMWVRRCATRMLTAVSLASIARTASSISS